MSDWEQDYDSSDDEQQQQPTVAKSKWEDDDDDIKDDWDASDSEDEEEIAKKKAAAAAAAKPKKTVAERIAEKQAERERAKQDEAATRAAQLARFEDGGDLDPKTAARLRRQRELENDMEAAGDLFSGLNIQDQELAQAIAKAQPKTKEEYEDLAKLLAERVHKHQRDGLYVLFLESVFRAVVEPLSDAQTRRLATLMTTVANEKQKQAKALATKGKKKTAAKPTLAADSGKGGRSSSPAVVNYNDDPFGGEQVYDDDVDDDFM